MRLDHFIARRYDFTGNKAQKLIKSGLISIEWKVIVKPGVEISWEEDIELKQDKSIAWVSRSAGKLDGFLDSVFRHSEKVNSSETRREGTLGCEGRIQIAKRYEHGSFVSQDDKNIQISWSHCLDIGASTWGFTQILLSRWAAHIDAVDVGTDQLHASIRDDPRVSSYEQTDIRDFNPLNLQPSKPPTFQPSKKYDIITIDVSFISLREIIPEFVRFADGDTDIFLLFKPQFEVGRKHLRHTWVPRSEKIIEASLREFISFLASSDYIVIYEEKSTVIGEAGNQEWMMWMKKHV